MADRLKSVQKHHAYRRHIKDIKIIKKLMSMCGEIPEQLYVNKITEDYCVRIEIDYNYTPQTSVNVRKYLHLNMLMFKVKVKLT